MTAFSKNSDAVEAAHVAVKEFVGAEIDAGNLHMATSPDVLAVALRAAEPHFKRQHFEEFKSLVDAEVESVRFHSRTYQETIGVNRVGNAIRAALDQLEQSIEP